GEFLFIAGSVQAAGGSFEQSLVDSFDRFYSGTDLSWAGAPSDPRPYTLFSGSSTYLRPGIAYIALRRILGADNFDAPLQQIQRTYGQGSVTEPQLEAAFASFLPVQTASCEDELGRFFNQWWDTAGVRPDLTGPGLDGGGFHC